MIHDDMANFLVWCVHIAKKAAEAAPHLNTAIYPMHLEYLLISGKKQVKPGFTNYQPRSLAKKIQVDFQDSKKSEEFFISFKTLKKHWKNSKFYQEF